MKNKLSQSFLPVLVIFILALFGLTACDYKAPLTSKPTSDIDKQLIGDWVSKDGKNHLKIRILDSSEYIISLDDGLARAFHSDMDGVRFVNVQDLDKLSGPGTYSLVNYNFSNNGKNLSVKIVDNKVIPFDLKTSEAISALVKQHLKDPRLFVRNVLEYQKVEPKS
jgi:hypothetical protein